jgi:hypothetical protein
MGASTCHYVERFFQNESAVETHRLSELLRMGTVPAVADATFADVPRISGKKWTEIAHEMRKLLLGDANGGKKLESLSRQAAKFYEDLENGMKRDMDVNFRGAFGLPNPNNMDL